MLKNNPIVQELAGIGDYELDLKKGTWVGSSSFCSMFGFEPYQTYTEEDFQKIVHPEDFERVMKLFAHCLETGDDFYCRYRTINQKTKKVIWVESKSTILLNTKKEPIKVIGLKRDITKELEDQKQVIEKVRQDTLKELIATTNHHINNSLTILVHELSKLEKNNEHTELLHKCRKSIYGISQVLANLVDISQGWKEFKTNKYTDHTNIFELENLSNSEKLIQAINKHFLVSITDKNGHITSVNQNYIDATGYSEDELIGSNHSIVKSGFHGNLFYKDLWETITHNKEWSGEIVNKSKNAEIYRVHSFIIPVTSPSGSIEHFLSIDYILK